MGSTTTAQSASHRTAAAFEQYVSGRGADAVGAAFFLEQSTQLDDVRRIAAPGDVIFTPGRGAGRTPESGVGGAPAIVTYEGDFLEAGDEMVLDDRHAFELQDYLAMPFLTIVGLTIVRLASAEGFAAFLSDADAARDGGVFLDQLLSSVLLLDSRSRFVEEPPDRLTRVHVTGAGEYRDGADGAILGEVGADREHLEAVVRRSSAGSAFSRIVSNRTFAEAMRIRPWLGRYLAAIDLMRQRSGDRAGLRVSGFGGHLLSALDEPDAGAAVLDADAPFLVTGPDDETVLIDRASRRRFRLGRDAARTVEALLACGDEERASDLLAQELRRPTHVARTAVVELRGRFADAGIALDRHHGSVA